MTASARVRRATVPKVAKFEHEWPLIAITCYQLCHSRKAFHKVDEIHRQMFRCFSERVDLKHLAHAKNMDEDALRKLAVRVCFNKGHGVCRNFGLLPFDVVHEASIFKQSYPILQPHYFLYALFRAR